MGLFSLPGIFAMLFGFAVFYVGSRYVAEGVGVYEKRFVQNVSTTLRNSFVFYDPKQIFLITMGCMAVAAIIGYLLIGWLGAIAFAVGVSLLPSFVLKLMRKRRIKAFIYQMPDCIGAMAASLRAGTNLARAIEQSAAQQPAPTSQEFSIIMSEYRMGRKLEDSLKDLHKRIPTPEVELMNSAISISQAVGGNLADTLDTLADTLREKAQVEGKIDALTSQGRMQGWVASLLPVGVALMLNKQEPEAMRSLWSEPIGWITLLIVGVLMIVAAMIIRKIVNIDV